MKSAGSIRSAMILAAGAAAAGAFFFAGVWLARATPNGPTADVLSVAGTLKQNGAPLGGMQLLKFHFKKGGAEACAPTAMVAVDKDSGAFNAPLSLAGCPAGLFDGADVTYTIDVNAAQVVPDTQVSAVPYAKYADRVGVPDCPVGWERDLAEKNFVLCRKGLDEMVKVGTGASAFFIDRYEALLSDAPTGGKQYGLGAGANARNDADDAGFLQNGQWQKPMYAQSRPGVTPSAFLTWFQANEACRNAGKRLPSGDEWIAAARGTPDRSPDCQFDPMNKGPRATGLGASCVSAWGAQDMIGNINEWTADWFAGLGDGMGGFGKSNQWPGAPYGGDATYNISAPGIYDIKGLTQAGLPAAALRGGYWNSGVGAGINYLELTFAPSGWQSHTGFRCVIR